MEACPTTHLPLRRSYRSPASAAVPEGNSTCHKRHPGGPFAWASGVSPCDLDRCSTGSARRMSGSRPGFVDQIERRFSCGWRLRTTLRSRRSVVMGRIRFGSPATLVLLALLTARAGAQVKAQSVTNEPSGGLTKVTHFTRGTATLPTASFPVGQDPMNGNCSNSRSTVFTIPHGGNGEQPLFAVLDIHAIHVQSRESMNTQGLVL